MHLANRTKVYEIAVVVFTMVVSFLMYVYARPDKYMAHTFKISETYATWLINKARTN